MSSSSSSSLFIPDGKILSKLLLEIEKVEIFEKADETFLINSSSNKYLLENYLNWCSKYLTVKGVPKLAELLSSESEETWSWVFIEHLFDLYKYLVRHRTELALPQSAVMRSMIQADEGFSFDIDQIWSWHEKALITASQEMIQERKPNKSFNATVRARPTGSVSKPPRFMSTAFESSTKQSRHKHMKGSASPMRTNHFEYASHLEIYREY